jgi:CHAT domain-containing protein
MNVPVHAAGIYDGPDQECCADYLVSSYVPSPETLQVVEQERGRWSSAHPKPGRLCLITAEKPHRLGLPPLPCVQEESRNIIAIARNVTNLSTVPYFSSWSSLPFLHIACHGIHHPSKPLESAFCLEGGDLTVEELMKSQGNFFFAFLSACETAKLDGAHPDQMINLATAMLSIGFKSVVGTMWCV